MGRSIDEAAAKKRAAPFWCVWCIFQVQSTAATGGASISEVATGGVGLAFTRAGIRRHALEALNPLAANVKFANRQDRPIAGGRARARPSLPREATSAPHHPADIKDRIEILVRK